MLLSTLSIYSFIAWAYCLPQNDIDSKSISSRDISPIAPSNEDDFSPSPAHDFYIPDELSIPIQNDAEFLAADANDCQNENPMKLQSRGKGACPPTGSANTPVPQNPAAAPDGSVQQKPHVAPQSTDNKNVCHAPFVHLMCCLASWYYQPAFRGCFTYPGSCPSGYLIWCCKPPFTDRPGNLQGVPEWECKLAYGVS